MLNYHEINRIYEVKDLDTLITVDNIMANIKGETWKSPAITLKGARRLLETRNYV
jgi:hypothetical protein